MCFKELLESENLIKMHELLMSWKIRVGFRNPIIIAVFQSLSFNQTWIHAKSKAKICKSKCALFLYYCNLHFCFGTQTPTPVPKTTVRTADHLQKLISNRRQILRIQQRRLLCGWLEACSYILSVLNIQRGTASEKKVKYWKPIAMILQVKSFLRVIIL